MPKKLGSNTFAPKSSRKPWRVTQDPCCSWLRSVSVPTGDCRYPPRAAITRGPNDPATPAAAAAPARLSSYHPDASRFPRLISPAIARPAPTSTSGMMPVSRMIESPTIVTVNSRPTSTGTYHRGRARSISSQMTSRDTAVPV